LWELPGLEGQYRQEDVYNKLKEWGFSIDHIESLGKAGHIFSHIEWHMIGYHIWLDNNVNCLATTMQDFGRIAKETTFRDLCPESKGVNEKSDRTGESSCIWADTL
jgi:hypothetical protein